MTDSIQKGKPQIHSRRVGRELAMQFLFQFDMNEQKVDDAHMESVFDESAATLGWPPNRLLRKGKEYAAILVKGTIANFQEIDDTLRGFSEKWDLSRMAVVDRNIMRVAIYEMLYVPDVPPVVSINEAVGIARDYSGEKSGNFINGILNGIKDTLKRPARDAVKEL